MFLDPPHYKTVHWIIKTSLRRALVMISESTQLLRDQLELRQYLYNVWKILMIVKLLLKKSGRETVRTCAQIGATITKF